MSNLLQPYKYQYELVSRDSLDASVDLEDQDVESTTILSKAHDDFQQGRSIINFGPIRIGRSISSSRRLRRAHAWTVRRCLQRPSFTHICNIFYAILALILLLLVFTAICNPSYTDPPSHYKVLSERALTSTQSGRVNTGKEKIFIAASIYDKGGELVSGAWGKAVLGLVDLLGGENVFLSIYENDMGIDIEAQTALKAFEKQLHCNNSLVYDEHLSFKDVPSVTLPDGTKRTKRIAYLAEVRNRALRPLNKPSTVPFDKILFLNDVIFNSVDAAQLLLSTNIDNHGRASYHAACALDFVNPFKFYDTFATRDLEGFSMGVPFFPFYSGAGNGSSRQDILDGKDAVRVKSCWGGMVAFDAKWFQWSRRPHREALNHNVQASKNSALYSNHSSAAPESPPQSTFEPIRFRAESELYWEASECCLVHADLASDVKRTSPGQEVGIYHNPFIRVAYDSQTLGWLRFTRRFERLYTIPHTFITRMVRMPWVNPRRLEEEGAIVKDRVWDLDEDGKMGSTSHLRNRVAESGGFCGMRALSVIKDPPPEGEKMWENLPVPKVP